MHIYRQTHGVLQVCGRLALGSPRPYTYIAPSRARFVFLVVLTKVVSPLRTKLPGCRGVPLVDNLERLGMTVGNHSLPVGLFMEPGFHKIKAPLETDPRSALMPMDTDLWSLMSITGRLGRGILMTGHWIRLVTLGC